MMKFHKPGRLRMLGGTAAVAMLGGLSLAFGSAGVAAPPTPPAPPAPPSADAPHDGAERHEERVIVRTIRRGEHRDHDADGARAERHESGDNDRHEEHRIVSIIATSGGDGPPHNGTIDIEGPDGHRIVVPRECEGQQRRFDASEGEGNNRTRVIVCSTGERSSAEQAESLQRARTRLAEDNQIPAEQRQRVLAAIDSEIARLRGQ